MMSIRVVSPGKRREGKEGLTMKVAEDKWLIDGLRGLSAVPNLHPIGLRPAPKEEEKRRQ